MNKKLLYTSPKCEPMAFQEKGMILTGSLNPLEEETDVFGEWTF